MQINKFIYANLFLKSRRPLAKKITRLFSEESYDTGDNLDNVTGLSGSVVEVPNDEIVGPGASKDGEYKTPEYYCFHTMSFYEAIVELDEYRLPQPSNTG